MSDITDQLCAENDALKERVERLERELAHLKMLFERSELQGANANEDTMREKLHLKVVPKPNEDKPTVQTTGATSPQPKPQTPAREFLMPDGRPVMIARHCVNFCAQAKEEGRTIVGVKGAVSAMPLMIEYAEFKEWWRAK
jgi:hypothetical protein